VALCTRGVLYMLYVWFCVNVVHMVLCTCSIVYMLYMLGCTTGTMLSVLCGFCIMTYVLIVLHTVYIYVLCFTPGVGVCVLLYIECKSIYCVVQ